MRTKVWKATKAGHCWPRCVIGSGVAHLVMLGVCLMVRPEAEMMRSVLRVRLVEEIISAAPSRIVAHETAPVVPRRIAAPAPPPVRPRPPAPSVPMVEPVPSRAPALEPAHDLPPATLPDLAAPPSPPNAPPPASAAPTVAASSLEPAAGGGAAEAPVHRGARDDGTRQETGSGVSSFPPSHPAESAARGVFLLSGTGGGGDPRNGSGAGSGSGFGESSGAGWGGGAGEGSGGTKGAGHTARHGGSVPSNGAGVEDLLRLIRRRIEQAKVYPDTARREGLQGTAEIRFRIGPDGSVATVEVVRSSGHALLDHESAETVRRAAPFPLLPGWIRIPLAYRLDQ